jgi:hypothetical protein
MNRHTILELRRDMVIRVQYRYRPPSQSIRTPHFSKSICYFGAMPPVAQSRCRPRCCIYHILPSHAWCCNWRPSLYPSPIRLFCPSFDTERRPTLSSDYDRLSPACYQPCPPIPRNLGLTSNSACNPWALNQYHAMLIMGSRSP